MSEVLQANIFFFITGVAVIIFTLLLCVALYHFIKVLRSLRRIMDRVEAGTEVVAEDMQRVRTFFTEEGLIPRLLGMLMGEKRHTRRGTRQHRQKADLPEDDNE